jgi:hypothetical protein
MGFAPPGIHEAAVLRDPAIHHAVAGCHRLAVIMSDGLYDDPYPAADRLLLVSGTGSVAGSRRAAPRPISAMNASTIMATP